MNKRVVIAHGWADDPSKGWIGWLTQQLNEQKIQATAPLFDNPRRPDAGAWMQTFRQAVGQPDEGLVLVGHSLGTIVIQRFLSDLAPTVRIAGIVLVAGMAEIPQWPDSIFFRPPLDFAKIQQIAAKRICIYSDDDDKVTPDRTKRLAELLDAQLIADNGKGHFAGLHDCQELPSALQAVLSCYTD